MPRPASEGPGARPEPAETVLPNPHRGEVAATIDGRPRILRLTLGSLAALENALDPPDLMALLQRFETGRPTARDVAGVIAAGLAGAGERLAPGVDAGAALDGGLPEAYRLAAALLSAAFTPVSEKE